MADQTLTTCPAPFLDLSLYPTTGGYVSGRFCGQISDTLTCCLPCPLVHWLYPDWLFRSAEIASWFNVPALVCQIFLLVTFTVLPQEKVHGRYMSVGLCMSLVLLQLAFIVPLGAQPDMCYNDITPKDMHSDITCAWSGALMETGSMAATVWILLRSLYTHLRVCWDVELTSTFMWIAHGLGWGLPLIFLAISLPVTGVSYRLISTCSPNPHVSFITWFGWLIAFACLGAFIQFCTTAFCLLVYARSLFVHSNQSSPGVTKASNNSTPSSPSSAQKTPTKQISPRNLAWKRVQKVLSLQWRSIVLSVTVTVIAAYAGIVYVVMTRTAAQDANPKQADDILNWSDCLVYNEGDKSACMDLAKPLRLGANQVIAALIMASLIGIFTFALMLRWSMLLSWWELITDPKGFKKRRNSLGFDLGTPSDVTKHMSLSRPLASEQAAKEKETETGAEEKPPSMPEPGDVSKRHETMAPFEFDFDEEKGEKRKTKEIVGDQDDVV